MESSKLYHVKKEDLPRLEDILYECFINDPLYVTLIPDVQVRRRLLPELLKCDMDEFYATCEIFADSSDLNGLIVVSDEAEPYNIFKWNVTEATALLESDAYIIKEDPSFKTLYNFILGENYLNSKWTEDLHDDNRLHIIYLAVDPKKQHHGIAYTLVEEVLKYADDNNMLISLETHNEVNLDFYKQFGFYIYEVVEKNFDLKQYCLIRDRKIK